MLSVFPSTALSCNQQETKRRQRKLWETTRLSQHAFTQKSRRRPSSVLAKIVEIIMKMWNCILMKIAEQFPLRRKDYNIYLLPSLLYALVLLRHISLFHHCRMSIIIDGNDTVISVVQINCSGYISEFICLCACLPTSYS